MVAPAAQAQPAQLATGACAEGGLFGAVEPLAVAAGFHENKKGKYVRGEGGEGCSRGSKGARRDPLALVGSRMAAEGQEVTAGAAAVLARRKDRPPLPRSLREAANEETSDEEWCAAEEQCEEDHETRIFLPASKYGRVRI